MNFKQKMARLSAIGVATGAAVPAFAATDPVSTLLSGIDLTAVGAAVLVIGALVVGISMSFKGVDVSKRAIRKV